MKLLLIQTMAGLTKHKTCSEKWGLWGDTYQSAHVSVSCAICPSPSGVTPLNRSPSHRPHHAGCLQPLDCVGEKVKDYRNKKTVWTCSLFWVLLPTCYMIWSFVQHAHTKKRTGRTGVWNLQCPGFSREMAAARTDSLPLNIHLSGSRLRTPAINIHKRTNIVKSSSNCNLKWLWTKTWLKMVAAYQNLLQFNTPILGSLNKKNILQYPKLHIWLIKWFQNPRELFLWLDMQLKKTEQ